MNRIPRTIALASLLVSGCATYQGAEQWRRSACDDSVDSSERDRCLEEATRPENEYRDDVRHVQE